jgi:ABC-type nitrate/sulfonate/bicarbonate transport system ATPase subunit
MSLVLENISKEYPGPGEIPTPALAGINLELENGRFTTLVGPSGCGKTTLLKIAAGLSRPTAGRVLLDGEEISAPTPKIGLVFQEFALFPWRNILKNIEFGLEIQGIKPPERRKQARELLRKTGLSGFENHFPRQLSEGMQQRVAIARTLATHPRVILMDEPFGALDSQTRNSMQEFLLKLFRDERPAILFVTHNIDEAVFLSQTVLGLSQRPGKIKADFSIELDYPKDRTSTEFNRYRREILEFLDRERKLIADR